MTNPRCGRHIDEQFLPANVTAIPVPVRVAIARVIAYNFSDEEHDYLECSDGSDPDANQRRGHIFEDLVLADRFLTGYDTGETIDPEVWICDPEPSREGFLKRTRRKSIGEVYDQVLAITGQEPEGADEGLSLFPGVDRDQPWPEGRIACFAVTGSNEGDYVHVEVIRNSDRVRHAELLFLGKTFSGPDSAWTLARRLACILGESK